MLKAVSPGDRIPATMNAFLEMPRLRARTSAFEGTVLARLADIVGKEHSIPTTSLILEKCLAELAIRPKNEGSRCFLS